MSSVSMQDATSPSSSLSERTVFFLVLGCFFLSGWAALVYQTVWMRQFAVVLGTSELAIATVLASYMTGLALGAMLCGRLIHRIKRPILVYGFLEVGIALGAMVIPLGLRFARSLQVLAIGGQSELPSAEGLVQPLFYVSVAFLLLLVPTACMGATLPLLTRYVVTRSEQIGRRVGALYSINTCGAVLGTIMAGFLILPAIGLWETTFLAMVANIAVFLIASVLEKRTESTAESKFPAVARSSVDQATRFVNQWILPLMLVSGVVSFTYEVMWSRLLGHIIGGSVYAFSTMLATFLTGITIGSAVASRLATTQRASAVGFTICQIGTALAAMAMYSQIDQIPTWSTELGAGGASTATFFANVSLCSLVLLPSTIFIGATYPFAVRLLSGDAEDAAAASAHVYGWNVFGSVAGALLSGFWIVPTLGFHGTVWACVAVGFCLAIATMFLCRSFHFRWGLALAPVCALSMFMFRPDVPENVLSNSTLMRARLDGEVLYTAVGRSSTVRLTDGNGYYLLQNNGLPEAIIGMKGTPPFGGGLHRWLTALPVAARPEAKSLLVIGFGGGTAVDSVPSSLDRIDVIELEPKVIEANRVISRTRDIDPLADSRVQVILNDARGAMSLSNRTYDLIVSQPSHPWTAGASHLYTKEFLSLAKQRLSADGVFLQWLDAGFVDNELFRTMGATLLSEFKNVRLYQPNSTSLFFLASDGTINPEKIVANRSEPIRSNYALYSRLPLTNVSELLACLTLDEEGMRQVCRGAPINTDNRNLLAFQSAPHITDDFGDSLSRFILSADPVLARRLELFQDELISQRINPGMMVRRMEALGLYARADAYAMSFEKPAMRHYLTGVIAHASGRTDDAKGLLRKALSTDPTLDEARFLLCDLYRDGFLNGRIPDDVRLAYELLMEPKKSVFNASLAMRRNDFQTMQKLDANMAQVSQDSQAFLYAMYYRAAWRAAPTGAPDSWIKAKEALELIDQGMSIGRRGEAYMIRMNAALLADEPDLLLETARHYTNHLTESADLPAIQAEATRHLPIVRKALLRLEDDLRVNPDAVSQVKRLVNTSAKKLLSPAEGEQRIRPVSYQR